MWSFVPAAGEKIDRKRRLGSCRVQGAVCKQKELLESINISVNYLWCDLTLQLKCLISQ